MRRLSERKLFRSSRPPSKTKGASLQLNCITANELNTSGLGLILSEWLLLSYSINSRTAYKEAA